MIVLKSFDAWLLVEEACWFLILILLYSNSSIIIILFFFSFSVSSLICNSTNMHSYVDDQSTALLI